MRSVNITSIKDRHRVKLMAEVYDPKLESFKTKQCVKLH